jgi:hypothetical protein
MNMRQITRTLTATLVGLALHGITFAQAPKGNGGGCFVAHFKSLALRTHHPEIRANLAEEWLKRYAASCSKEQLASIQANSPNWLGTALTLEISSIIDATMEAKAAGNPAMLAQMYESAGQEFKSGNVTHSNPTPRAPVVQPSGNAMPMAGVVNYGNMAGNGNYGQMGNANPAQAIDSSAAPASPLHPRSR